VDAERGPLLALDRVDGADYVPVLCLLRGLEQEGDDAEAKGGEMMDFMLKV
jgi:hypothetical protein